MRRARVIDFDADMKKESRLADVVFSVPMSRFELYFIE